MQDVALKKEPRQKIPDYGGLPILRRERLLRETNDNTEERQGKGGGEILSAGCKMWDKQRRFGEIMEDHKNKRRYCHLGSSWLLLGRDALAFQGVER